MNNELNFPPRGSFSAVSTPISSSKYSLESSRRDLYSALLCTVLIPTSNIKCFVTFFFLFANFSRIILINFASMEAVVFLELLEIPDHWRESVHLR